MTRIKTLMAGAAFALLLGACAGGAPVKYNNGVMAGNNGMTLYTFDKDPAGAGKSVCNGQCATNWPPFMAGAGEQASGEWTIITRDDGAKQWAYSGKPLYYWGKDQKPGDTTGDGVNKVWHAVRSEAKPAGSMY